jgi:hypothetical protein
MKKNFLVFLFALMLMIPMSMSAQFYSNEGGYLGGDGLYYWDDLSLNGNPVIIDFGLRTYMHDDYDSYDPADGFPAIEFWTQFPVTDVLSMAFYGSFYNTTANSTQTSTATGAAVGGNGTTYNVDALDPDLKGRKKTVDSFNNINNELAVVFNITSIENVVLGFYIGGGSHFSEYAKETVEKDFVDAYAHEETWTNGYGFIEIGIGANLDGAMFNDALAYFTINEEFKLSFGNDGTRVYKRDGVEKSFEKREFFYFGNLGYFEPAVNLHDKVAALGALKRFRLKPTIEYTIQTTIPTLYKDDPDTDIEGNEIVYGSQQTNLIGGGVLGLELDLMPNSSHRFRLKYAIRIMDEHFVEDYQDVANSENNNVYTNDYFTLRHEVKARYRITFPKIVYLESEIRYRITQAWNYEKTYYTESPMFDSEGNTYAVSHNIRPKLKLGFDFGVTALTFSWRPVIAIASDAAETAASNLLNLANWDIAFVLSFDPKSL